MRTFLELFGHPPDVRADAPGRVNLIGEHTDYNDGFVLPTAIPQRTYVELALRTDSQVRVFSTASGIAPQIVSYALGAESPRGNWLDYVQGVTSVLRQQGCSLQGFDARIDSQVPVGSGLSSSAALSVSLLRALRLTLGLRLDDVALARIGQQSENSFVGAQVGIMDPMAASLADEKTALFLDARSLEYERVPLPEGLDLVVIDSGVAHVHAAGDYNRRRVECERACSALGVRQLRDLDRADLPRLGALPEPLARRVRHVITENERVLAAVAALRAQDLCRLGELFYASHASMREDYEVSIPPIDLLVELARLQPAVYGARLTGGGFGGAVVILVRAGMGTETAQTIVQCYNERSPQPARILVPELIVSVAS